MANTQQAEKRARQAKTRAFRNVAQRSVIKTAVKKVLKALQTNDENLERIYQKTVSVLDKMAGRRVIHRNKAARLKSRLYNKIKTLKNG